MLMRREGRSHIHTGGLGPSSFWPPSAKVVVAVRSAWN